MNHEPTTIDESQLQTAQAWLATADSVLITAGAGMGVDSGMPDFRGDQGFWKAYPALAEAGIDFMSAANPDNFKRNPRLGWGFYGHRLDLYRKTRPHLGFRLLREYARTRRNGYFVFTSNVDGHFQKAKFEDDRVAECHGTIHYLQCMTSCTSNIWPATMSVKVDETSCQWLGELPACPYCGGLARPNIRMFGDHNWLPARTNQQENRLLQWLQRATRPVIVEMGAGTAIATVRAFSETILRSHPQARLIRINPRECEVPAGTRAIGLPVGAGAGITELLRQPNADGA